MVVGRLLYAPRLMVVEETKTREEQPAGSQAGWMNETTDAIVRASKKIGYFTPSVNLQ